MNMNNELNKKSYNPLQEILPIVEEKNLTFDDLLNADEAFYSGTAVEITPITIVNESKIGIGSIGPITDILQKKYSDIVCGKDQNYSDWLTAI